MDCAGGKAGGDEEEVDGGVDEPGGGGAEPGGGAGEEEGEGGVARPCKSQRGGGEGGGGLQAMTRKPNKSCILARRVPAVRAAHARVVRAAWTTGRGGMFIGGS